MEKDLTNTKILANELLLEKYKPVMVVKLSRAATLRLVSRLKEFAIELGEKTNYEILVFPDEEKTEVEIISVCKADHKELKNALFQVFFSYKILTIFLLFLSYSFVPNNYLVMLVYIFLTNIVV